MCASLTDSTLLFGSKSISLSSLTSQHLSGEVIILLPEVNMQLIFQFPETKFPNQMSNLIPNLTGMNPVLLYAKPDNIKESC